MKRRARRSFKKFLDQIRQTHPEASHPESLIRSGQVLVDGRIVKKPGIAHKAGGFDNRCDARECYVEK
jgi:hypothetical protein